MIVMIADTSSRHRKKDKGYARTLSEDCSLLSSGPGIAVQDMTEANKEEHAEFIVVHQIAG